MVLSAKVVVVFVPFNDRNSDCKAIIMRDRKAHIADSKLIDQMFYESVNEGAFFIFVKFDIHKSALLTNTNAKCFK